MPALRGPARSSQPPNTAAERPSITMPMEKTVTRSLTRQSQVVVTRAVITPMSGQAAALDRPTLSARERGSQNTARPQAMPMQRWMANADDGTSQRLKPGLATMFSRDSQFGAGTGVPARG